MNNFFKELFDYNLWSVQRQVQDLARAEEVCKQSSSISFGSIYGLAQHLHYHDLKVYQKITDPLNTEKPLKEYAWEILLPSMLLQATQWLALVANYQIDANSAKELQLVYTHNVYHRGQIAAALALAGVKTNSLDPYLYADKAKS